MIFIKSYLFHPYFFSNSFFDYNLLSSRFLVSDLNFRAINQMKIRVISKEGKYVSEFLNFWATLSGIVLSRIVGSG